MVVEVVDTNVWVMMDKLSPENAVERECVLACIQWGSAFNKGADERQIAVDDAWKILTEYRRNIKKGGLAEQYLNALLSQPRKRLALVTIQFDENGDAILPDLLQKMDRSDRKFAAVALTFQPPAPIINATDTDWMQAKEKLNEAGIKLEELCPKYIQDRLKI
jgi:hypothetical protein